MLVACSSDDSARDTRDDYERGLAALCDGLHYGVRRCELPDPDPSYCGYHPTGVRGSSLAAVGACLRHEECARLALEQPADHCFDEVRSTQPLSDGVIAYCESAATSYFRCNVWWSVEDCTEQMSLWSDDVLQAATLCHEQPCDTLESCEKITFAAPP